jgi:hypothetical protein
MVPVLCLRLHMGSMVLMALMGQGLGLAAAECVSQSCRSSPCHDLEVPKISSLDFLPTRDFLSLSVKSKTG